MVLEYTILFCGKYDWRRKTQ